MDEKICEKCGLPLEVGLKCGKLEVGLTSGKPGKLVHQNGMEECPKTWRDAEEKIKKHFPKSLKVARVCASVVKALEMKILTQPMGILVVGSPSGQKTTALRFFKKIPSCLWLDDFSSASFVSHQPGAKEQDLKERDLLPQLKNSTLIAPEFSSVLEGSADKIAEKLGRLTRIMDGDGFRSASGAHGIRGYEGRHDFIFLAASVPLSADNWDLFVRAGARFLFVNSPSEFEFKDMLPNEEYLSAIEACQLAVGDALYFKSPIPTIREEQRKAIFELSNWVAKLRGVVSVRGTRFVDDRGSQRTAFQSDQPIIEAPPRLYSMFCVLAQGHAALYGRSHVEHHDLKFLHECAMDCGRFDRVRFLAAMPKKPSSVRELSEKILISRDTIRRKLAELAGLGLAEVSETQGDGDKPTKLYVPRLFEHELFTEDQEQLKECGS